MLLKLFNCEYYKTESVGEMYSSTLIYGFPGKVEDKALGVCRDEKAGKAEYTPHWSRRGLIPPFCRYTITQRSQELET